MHRRPVHPAGSLHCTTHACLSTTPRLTREMRLAQGEIPLHAEQWQPVCIIFHNLQVYPCLWIIVFVCYKGGWHAEGVKMSGLTVGFGTLDRLKLNHSCAVKRWNIRHKDFSHLMCVSFPKMCASAVYSRCCAGYRGCCHSAQMVGVFFYLFIYFFGGGRRG